MSVLLASLVLAADPLPSLADRDRFPPWPLVNAQLGFLIESRFITKGKLALEPARAGHWRQRLIENDHQLRAWEELLAAHGALAEEEGGRGDDEFCRESLGRLRALIGANDYAAGQMP